MINEKQEKFEEIKNLAFDLFKNAMFFNHQNGKIETIKLEEAWRAATDFYNLVKEKEGEMINGSA
jgi:hypothetical protein